MILLDVTGLIYTYGINPEDLRRTRRSKLAHSRSNIRGHLQEEFRKVGDMDRLK
jgi:hypothetical protein